MMDDGDRIDVALDTIMEYGGIGGSDHKQWVLDQVVRALCFGRPGAYEQWVKDYSSGENGHDTYRWDKGIAP